MNDEPYTEAIAVDHWYAYYRLWRAAMAAGDVALAFALDDVLTALARLRTAYARADGQRRQIEELNARLQAHLRSLGLRT